MSELSKCFRMFLIVYLLCLTGLPAAQAAVESKSEFLARNPNNGWAFGYLNQAGKFVPYNTPFQIDGDIVGWCLDSCPGVFGDVTVSFGKASTDKFGIRRDPGLLCVNPGLSGQGVVLRWTAPTDADVQVACDIKSLSSEGGKTRVEVRKNGMALNGNEIGGPPRNGGQPFTGTAQLSTAASVTKGAYLDFVFARQVEPGAVHVGVNLRVDSSGPGGLISYSPNPSLSQTGTQVADATLAEEVRN